MTITINLDGSFVRRASALAIACAAVCAVAETRAGSVPTLEVFTPGTTISSSAVNQNFTDLQTAVNDNDARLAALEVLLAGVARVGSDRLVFTGMDVQIVNGDGSTHSSNGKGNLILGYNEGTTTPTRTGSHNLVIGEEHGYTGQASLVLGYQNAVGTDSAVLGGYSNSASTSAVIVGGYNNQAVDGHRSHNVPQASVIVGGHDHTMVAPTAVIVGGNSTTLDADLADPVGTGRDGINTTAIGCVSGTALNMVRSDGETGIATNAGGVTVGEEAAYVDLGYGFTAYLGIGGQPNGATQQFGMFVGSSDLGNLSVGGQTASLNGQNVSVGNGSQSVVIGNNTQNLSVGSDAQVASFGFESPNVNIAGTNTNGKNVVLTIGQANGGNVQVNLGNRSAGASTVMIGANSTNTTVGDGAGSVSIGNAAGSAGFGNNVTGTTSLGVGAANVSVGP